MNRTQAQHPTFCCITAQMPLPCGRFTLQELYEHLTQSTQQHSRRKPLPKLPLRAAALATCAGSAFPAGLRHDHEHECRDGSFGVSRSRRQDVIPKLSDVLRNALCHVLPGGEELQVKGGCWWRTHCSWYTSPRQISRHQRH